jgi:prepilin-type N-terminal cleavage/methylation domain-containing protein
MLSDCIFDPDGRMRMRMEMDSRLATFDPLAGQTDFGKHPGNARAGARAGFTLVEVLVALVVLSTGIVLVLRAFETSLSALRVSRQSLWAAVLVRNILAETQTALAAGETVPAYGRGRSASGPVEDFQWERIMESVRRPGGAAGTNLQLRVEVSAWREDPERRYTVTTYLLRED